MTSPASLRSRRTFRWNDGESPHAYQGVEASQDELVFFRWSHVHGEGRIDEVRQPAAAFLVDGPCRPMPGPAQAALRAWLAGA